MLPLDRHYSRRDSNPDLRFRRPTFYPLNYGSGSSSRRERIRSEPERTISRVLPVSISITKNGSVAKSTVKVSRTRISLNISPERSIPSPIHRYRYRVRYRYRKITVIGHEIQKSHLDRISAMLTRLGGRGCFVREDRLRTRMSHRFLLTTLKKRPLFGQNPRSGVTQSTY